MKISLPFKAIIFDMDGTLLQSTEADYRAWERVFAHYDKRLTYGDYLPMLGIRSRDVIMNVLCFKDEADIARILVEKFNHFADYANEHPVLPVEGAKAFLQRLTGFDIKIGLATSSRKEKTNLLLNKLGMIDYFEALTTGEQVQKSKPAPDIFLLAAERLGVSPQDCVVIEDGPVGVAAAKNAGMKCIAITATHEAEHLAQADVIIDGYESVEIDQLLKALK